MMFCAPLNDAGRAYSALVGVTDAEGKSIFTGKAATGFSNTEEEQVNKVKVSNLKDEMTS